MIYKVQRVILLVFYTTSMMALSIPLASLISNLFPGHLYPLVASLVLYMVLAVVLGSLIHTISYISHHLASAFDPIKNEIASGEIRTIDELGKRVTEFTVSFFDFSFLDIDHAFLYSEQTGPVSHEDLSAALQAMEELGLPEMSQTTEDIIRAGKVIHAQKAYHLYILPIWFGKKWLGYMGLLSKHRFSRFSMRFLMEYENNFLDDQIMLVTPQTR